MDEWMDEAFRRAWMNYANKSLLDMGLIPRTQVTLQKIAPMGDPIQIQVRGYELTLRREDAARIEVRL